MAMGIDIRPNVLLPYRFTLFSNEGLVYQDYNEFYYLIDLHYSQTLAGVICKKFLFYYLIDLHYSQTRCWQHYFGQEFYYLIDLHYSQTRVLFTKITTSFTTL